MNNLIELNKSKTNEKALEKVFEKELKKENTYSERINIEIIHATLLADLYYKENEILNPKSETLYKEAVAKALKNNSELTIWVHTQFGFYFYTNSLYKNALPYFLTASKLIDESISDLTIQPTEVLKKNAFYFGMIEDYTKEAIYLKKALKITSENSFDYGTLLNSLGRNYAKNGNNELAAKYYNETLRISKLNNDEVRYAKALGDLAGLFEENKNWAKAEEFLLKDIAISKEHNGERNTMYAQIQLGNLYYKKNNYDKALEVLNPAEIYARSKSNLKGFEEQIAKLKLAIAIKQNDDKTELEQRRRLDTLSLYVSKTDGEQVINRINLEARKENIKLQLVAAKAQAEKQVLIKKIVIGISVVLLCLIILMFIVYKRKLKPR
ncbi:tetratricopeptide repeat protein [Flavobacterium ardleyense]|uniref:Tetratricopeptide repeat protein n=1 Tax=Flavobacterium ardleyense TaxID=2038737 RepID=A0ABW5Z8L7_9FLAO